MTPPHPWHPTWMLTTTTCSHLSEGIKKYYDEFPISYSLLAYLLTCLLAYLYTKDWQRAAQSNSLLYQVSLLLQAFDNQWDLTTFSILTLNCWQLWLKSNQCYVVNFDLLKIKWKIKDASLLICLLTYLLSFVLLTY